MNNVARYVPVENIPLPNKDLPNNIETANIAKKEGALQVREQAEFGTEFFPPSGAEFFRMGADYTVSFYSVNYWAALALTLASFGTFFRTMLSNPGVMPECADVVPENRTYCGISACVFIP